MATTQFSVVRLSHESTIIPGRHTTSLWAGKEWDGDDLRQAQDKGWLSQWRGMPRIPPVMPSSGCKASTKITENIDGANFHPQGKESEGTKRAPNGQRASCCIENTNDSALSESFYFCLLASVIWFQSYSLNHSEICFCMKGQLCHSCFPNFKLKDIHQACRSMTMLLDFLCVHFQAWLEREGY